MYSSGAWCAASLAILLVGCATIPDGSVTFSPDEMVTLVTNYARLVTTI